MREKVEKKHKDLGCGLRGGVRKNGEHGSLTFRRPKKTIRGGKKTKVSRLSPIIDELKKIFEVMRSSGQYVDRYDLLIQFIHEASQKRGELLKKQAAG